LYVASGYPGDALRPLYAIRPGATGDITLKAGETANEFIAWSHPQLGTYSTSAVVYNGIIYTLLDRGFLLAHDAKTGAEVYKRQRISVGTAFTASPWAYNDRIFALSEDGDTYVFQAGREFKLLGQNSLGEMVLATPAIVRRSLIIRTAAAVYRIAKPGTR
jgi:outer membrane protein assembly factor BamB